MSDLTATLTADIESAPAPKSFLQHAKLIGFLTLISRFFGLGRDIVAAHFLGAKTGRIGFRLCISGSQPIP